MAEMGNGGKEGTMYVSGEDGVSSGTDIRGSEGRVLMSLRAMVEMMFQACRLSEQEARFDKRHRQNHLTYHAAITKLKFHRQRFARICAPGPHVHVRPKVHLKSSCLMWRLPQIRARKRLAIVKSVTSM